MYSIQSGSTESMVIFQLKIEPFLLFHINHSVEKPAKSEHKNKKKHTAMDHTYIRQSLRWHLGVCELDIFSVRLFV